MPDLVVITQSGSRTYRGTRRAGFTLVDVLVSMAVIAVLISLLMPALGVMRESSRQVVCRSNVRQFGLGMQMYADANQDFVPRSSVDAVNRPWDSLYLKFGDANAPATPPGFANEWDGLGTLYSTQYLPAPKLFYCPSHRGSNPFSAYEEQWGTQTGPLVGNYQYRGRGPLAGARPPATTNILPAMIPTTALVADGMRLQSDFNHVVGTTVLRANLSVSWYNDTDRDLLSLLPRDSSGSNMVTFNSAWHRLDVSPDN